MRIPTETQWEFAHRFERSPLPPERRSQSWISDLDWKLAEFVHNDRTREASLRWGRWGHDVEVVRGSTRDLGTLPRYSAGGNMGFRLVLFLAK